MEGGGWILASLHILIAKQGSNYVFGLALDPLVFSQHKYFPADYFVKPLLLYVNKKNN